jgi:hypothetical protein
MDRLRRILPGSASSAFAALLMVGAIAFGSTVIRPMTINHEPEATTAQADDGSAGTDGSSDGGTTAAADLTPGFEQAPDKDAGEADEDYPEWKPADEPTAQPKEEPKEEPKDEPKSEPAPSTTMKLEAVFNADKGKLVVEWSAYTGNFEKYKLVRSTDGSVSWPEGEGDTLVGVIGPDDARRFVDYDAPCNTELHYRVFAVRHGEEGYVVLAASNVDGASRPCAEPPADPVALAFEVGQGAEGVQLSWQQCSDEHFVVYKVVRSATNENPVYPLNDGTELIGVFENAEVTGFTDSNVEAGQTWTYRVLCMGQNGDGWYVIGQTAAMSVTVE